jgi:diguanylate cyclase (GGDEF)-like protein/PAS domain S-box-containing protein
MQHLKSNKWIYFSIATYISCIILFATYSYVQERRHLCSILDFKLQTAALAITSLLPDDFHHKTMKRSDLAEQQHAANTTNLSQYATQNNLSNLYTLILRDGKIFFSSENNPELISGQVKYNIQYFTPYTDASPYLYEVFNQSNAAYIEYNDRWGHFRSIFVPLHTKDGSVYLAAADISIDNITTELNNTLYFTLKVAVLFMLFIFLPAVMHTLTYRRQVQCLRNEVELRTAELVQSEAKLTSIFEHSPVGLFHYNSQGELLRTNRRFEAIVGAKKDGLIGFNMFEHVKNAPLASAVSQSLTGKVSNFSGAYTSVSSKKFSYLQADFVPLYSRSGEIEGGVGVCDDITERQLNTENLKKLSRVVECSLDGIIITNTDGIIEYANPQFSHITGYAASEAVGQKANFFRSGKTANSIYEELWGSILSGQEWTGELRNKKKNNELFWAQVTIVPMTNDVGEVTHFIGIQVDITEARVTSQQIAYQAKHDMLTGLINRYEFEHELTKAVTSAQQNNITHALCFLDLDQFKIINDTCGHAAGDELLRQVALLLQSNIRQQDPLARLGGDEFAILMQHCDLQHAEQTANKILTLIKKFQFIWHNRRFSIGVSIGIAQISSVSGNTTEALIHADLACYAAKDSGRNRVHIYQ